MRRPSRPEPGQPIPPDFFGKLWDWIRSLEPHGDGNILVTTLDSGTLFRLRKAAGADITVIPPSSLPPSFPSSIPWSFPSSLPSSGGPFPPFPSSGIPFPSSFPSSRPSSFPSSGLQSSGVPGSSGLPPSSGVLPSSVGPVPPPTDGWFTVLTYFSPDEDEDPQWYSHFAATEYQADGTKSIGETYVYHDGGNWLLDWYYLYFSPEEYADPRQAASNAAYDYMVHVDDWPIPPVPVPRGE